MNNHQRMLFVVLHVGRDYKTAVIGVYDDFRDADDKRQEEPEQFIITLAPYYPALLMEP